LTRAELAELLGGWKGYELGTVGRLPVDGERPEEVWLELLPRLDRTKRCSGCQQCVEAVHDTEERWIRDLPLLGTPVQLLVHRCRLACPRCGPKLEHLDWLGRYQRVTRRLAESVARLARGCHSNTLPTTSVYIGAPSKRSISAIWRKPSGRWTSRPWR